MITIPKTGVRLGRDKALHLWQTIEQYKMPFGPEYLNYKLRWNTEYGSEAIAEYKKFAFLALLSNSEITPSENVDEVWHYHILHTADYAAFAQRCGEFLHHSPGMPSGRPRFNKQYLNTHRLYEEVFGSEPPSEIWPLKKWPMQNRGPAVSKVLELYLSRRRAAPQSI